MELEVMRMAWKTFPEPVRKLVFLWKTVRLAQEYLPLEECRKSPLRVWMQIIPEPEAWDTWTERELSRERGQWERSRLAV